MLSVAAWPAAFAEVLQQGLENRALALEDLARRVDSVVQVRAVVLIALLARHARTGGTTSKDAVLGLVIGPGPAPGL